MTSGSDSAKKDDYLLARDYIDNIRVNLQHYLWCEIFGYRLHPSLPTDDPSLKIADVGTGSGIWLTDLAERLPSTVQLDGLDISFNQAPARDLLPKNMSLKHFDATQEPPPELQGQYDIVNVRLFIFVVKNNADVIIKNLSKLLKPGGWLQWADVEFQSMRIEKPSPEVEGDAIEALYHLIGIQDERLRPQWPKELPRLFKEQGLVDVSCDAKDARPYQAFAMHECNMLIYDMLAKSKGSSDFTDKLNEILPRALEQTRQGAGFAFTRLNVIGKKQ